MRFKFAILGMLILQTAVLVAQDPAPPSGTNLPQIRRGRHVITPGSAGQETPPPTQPSPNGIPAGQQQPAQVVGQPGAVTPSSPAQVGPQQVGVPGPANPVQALSQLSLAPPTPPEVTYRDGQLTVHALNSTLSSVLAAIRNKTGIQFEGLDTASERVVVSMGPAPEGEVLAAILTGSHYDYIAVDRSDSPGIVQRVVLTPRIGDTAQPTIGGAPATSVGEDEEAADDDPDNVRSPQDTPAHPPVMQAQPNPPSQPRGNQLPTPDQLVEEMKQIQQRQQQQPPAPQKQPPQ